MLNTSQIMLDFAKLCLALMLNAKRLKIMPKSIIMLNMAILNGVLLKKWHFPSMGRQGASLCACCFVPVVQRHALKSYRPIEKVDLFFLHIIS